MNKMCADPQKTIMLPIKHVYYINDTWSMALNDYGPKNKKCCRYNPVIFDNFSNFGRTIQLKNNNEQSIKVS